MRNGGLKEKTADLCSLVGECLTPEQWQSLQNNEHSWDFFADKVDGGYRVTRLIAKPPLRNKVGKLGDITVVDVRYTKPDEAPNNLVYIGRTHPRGWKESTLHNPFKPSEKVDAIAMFKKHLWGKMQDDNSPQMQELLRIIDLLYAGTDVQLGCWCAPNPCHGDVVKAALLHLMK